MSLNRWVLSSHLRVAKTWVIHSSALALHMWVTKYQMLRPLNIYLNQHFLFVLISNGIIFYVADRLDDTLNNFEEFFPAMILFFFRILLKTKQKFLKSSSTFLNPFLWTYAISGVRKKIKFFWFEKFKICSGYFQCRRPLLWAIQIIRDILGRG